MYDQNIQKMLNTLDTPVQKGNLWKRVSVYVAGFVVCAGVVAGGYMYTNSVPQVSDETLARLIVVASRTSDNDPVRILGDVERHIGKSVQDFSRLERTDAITYLMQHIELHHKNQELISY